jgi:hypothetical protein
MRYWWVNQNQTYRHEVEGGYLWSPKRNANRARNPFYESMREVAPGDLIFSFMDTRILAVGIAQSYCWESPTPQEFGTAGQTWENIGWKVKVRFTELQNKVRPKDHIGILRPLLPEKYSPLQPNGNGLQSVYLTEIPGPLAEVLTGLIGSEVASLAATARDVKPVPTDDLSWPRRLLALAPKWRAGRRRSTPVASGIGHLAWLDQGAGRTALLRPPAPRHEGRDRCRIDGCPYTRPLRVPLRRNPCPSPCQGRRRPQHCWLPRQIGRL